MDTKLEHAWKTLVPRLVTELGIVIPVKLVLPYEHCASNSVTELAKSDDSKVPKELGGNLSKVVLSLL